MSDSLTRLTAALSDRYRIERELGHGGMATVYLARDLKHDRDVAIKVFRPQLAAALGSERFLAEIRTTASLQHPHILPLHDSGDVDGVLFYVMPYINGETLRDRLTREEQLPVEDAIHIATDIAAALDYAHRSGVIHRDIKPENILLHEGDAMLADFGIALAVRQAGGERITGTGLSLGTPHYMSPEQAAGERELDPRSDIYSLGALTYEMLAGEPPITGPSHRAIVARLLTETPRSLRVVRNAVPVEVDAAVMRALAKAPSDRFVSAGKFAAALDPAATPAAPAKTGAPRSRAVPFIVAAIVLVVLAVLGVRLLRPHTNAVRRLAVLPLASARGTADSGLMADGMTRSVIEALTEAGVPVVGHRSVTRYRGSDRPLKDIARELGADALVAGTVSQVNGQVEVSVELTDPETGQDRWAHTYRRPEAEILLLQNDAARDIAAQTHATVNPQHAEVVRRVNPEAYAAYLTGKRLDLTYGLKQLFEADTMLRRSIALDSTFAPAYAEWAMNWAYRAWFSTPDSVARPMAKQAIDRAFALDPMNADAFLGRAVFRTMLAWDFPGAESDFRRVIDLRPDAQAHDFYGWFLGLMFRSDEAIVESHKALALDPRDPAFRDDLVISLLGAGLTDQALAQADTVIAMDPTGSEPIRWRALMRLEAGRLPEAEADARRYESLTGAPIPFWRPLVLAHTGHGGEARKLMSAMEQKRLAEGLPRRESSFAHVYLALGDTTTTLEILSDAADRHETELLRTLYFPAMHRLARTPRGQAVRDKMGIPK